MIINPDIIAVAVAVALAVGQKTFRVCSHSTKRNLKLAGGHPSKYPGSDQLQSTTGNQEVNSMKIYSENQ